MDFRTTSWCLECYLLAAVAATTQDSIRFPKRFPGMRHLLRTSAWVQQHRVKRVSGMSGNDRFDPKAGPLGNLSQACFGGLDMMVKGYEPALKGVGRWNLELVGLMTRRSQAWLEVPVRLGACKTPVDVFNE